MSKNPSAISDQPKRETRQDETSAFSEKKTRFTRTGRTLPFGHTPRLRRYVPQQREPSTLSIPQNWFDSLVLTAAPKTSKTRPDHAASLSQVPQAFLFFYTIFRGGKTPKPPFPQYQESTLAFFNFRLPNSLSHTHYLRPHVDGRPRVVSQDGTHPRCRRQLDDTRESQRFARSL